MVQSARPTSTQPPHSDMKILAIETSGNDCSAALLIDDQLEQRCETAPRRHADLILGMLEALLQGANVHLSALDAIAYGRGPGSFTGVRIAAAVAQGIAFGANRPVIGVSTLAATARAAYRQTGQRKIACALDARMGEVYWGCYRIDDDDQVRLIDLESVVAPEHTPVLDGSGWCGAGSGWEAYPALAERHQASLMSDADPDPDPESEPIRVRLLADSGPQAEDIAWLARATAQNAQRPDQALPVYLRNRVTDVRPKPADSS